MEAQDNAAPAHEPVMNRNLVVVGAILIQLCLGAIYAWSVFTPHLAPKLPKKDKKTGVYNDMLVFVEKDNVLVGKVVPKEPKAKEGQKLVGMEVLTCEALEEGAGPDKLPADKAGLKKVAIQVVVAEDFDEAKSPLTASAAEVEAAQARWTKTQTQIVFAAGLATFAVIMVLAGRMMPKLGPRTVAMAGGVVLGAGYALAGLLGAKSFAVTLLFVGFVGGAGIGLAYVVPIAVGMRWFPDKKGMITGLAVAGFGFGALLWVKLAGSWGGLLASMGIGPVFIIYGIVFLVLVVVGGIWMVFPPEGWKPAGWEPPVATAGTAPAAGTVDFTSGEMLGTPQFYMILLTFAFSASAGLMSIGLMKLFPPDALAANGYSEAAASAIAGTAMAVFFSLANGIGRIAWGTMSDVLGRKLSIIIMCATQGVIVIAFQKMAGTPGLLYLGATIIGFNFGGNFALFPTVTADTFGTKYVGQNYGWVFLAYGVGGIFGPILGGKLGDMGNFPMAFTICGILCLVAAGVIGMVKPAQKPDAEAEAPEQAADVETDDDAAEAEEEGESSDE